MTDLSIRPSHSWRHLFNTLSREHELERDVRKAMVGHMDDATAERYGGATAKAKRKQIEKLPSPKRT
jgi:integrase